MEHMVLSHFNRSIHVVKTKRGLKYFIQGLKENGNGLRDASGQEPTAGMNCDL